MKLTKKSLLIIGIFIMIIGIGYVVFLNSSLAATKNVENNDLTKTVELQKNEISLINELGNNTPYPQVYITAEILVQLKGVDNDEAIAQATESYIEKQALVWYAEECGIGVTNLEFEQHLNSLINTVKDTDDYDELDKAYKSAGLSIEDIYRGNSSYYRDDYIISKLYDQWLEDYTEDRELISENEMESVDAAWKNFIVKTTASYKKSQTYKELQPALTGTQKMYIKGIGRNVKTLKKSSIFISPKKK